MLSAAGLAGQVLRLPLERVIAQLRSANSRGEQLCWRLPRGSMAVSLAVSTAVGPLMAEADGWVRSGVAAPHNFASAGRWRQSPVTGPEGKGINSLLRGISSEGGKYSIEHAVFRLKGICLAC